MSKREQSAATLASPDRNGASARLLIECADAHSNSCGAYRGRRPGNGALKSVGTMDECVNREPLQTPPRDRFLSRHPGYWDLARSSGWRAPATRKENPATFRKCVDLSPR